MLSCENRPSRNGILAAATSLAASAILARTVADNLVPDQLRDHFSSLLRRISGRLSSRTVVVIEESSGLTPNHMFDAANTYLGARMSPTTRRFKVEKSDKEKDLAVSMDRNQEIVDAFAKVEFRWVMSSSSRVEHNHTPNARSGGPIARSENRFFELSFHKKHREMALRAYLPHVLREARTIRENRKAVKLHTVDYNGSDYWGAIDLDHPATFATMAMDPAVKQALVEDLEMFRRRKEYHRRAGRAWKRGYLLYGPPGTGKSSLVAAMANHLRFSIYDLDLTEVQCNSDLRRLLIGTASRSILVIEDVDCSPNLMNRENSSGTATVAEGDEKVNLSAVLNFIDGLWSSCGDERIIIFTTNHKDRLDPALLRPGRMDVHIEMSYCRFSGFKVLANNYLGIREHRRFSEIEELLEVGGVQATPAAVAGELMRNDDADVALDGLIKFLQTSKGATQFHRD